MWEDNNPLSYDRNDTPDIYSNPTDYGINPEYMNQAGGDTDTDSQPEDNAYDPNITERREDDYEDEEDTYQSRRAGGYSSRVEQYLMENKDLAILITDAGKNLDSGGNFIVYTIKTGDLEVRRRYSEFESLRKNLALLHPTLIVPPIPDKHSFSDYASAPRSAKEDVNMIDLRKRMLGVFLNRCARMKEIREDSIFLRFLDPNASWSEVLTSPPISTIPKNPLKAPPLDPSNPTPAHAFLPIPSSSAKLKPGPPSAPSQSQIVHTRFPAPNSNLTEYELDPYFNAFESNTREYESILTGSIEKVNRRIIKRMSELSTDYAELGARYNGFSLSEQGSLSAAIEKTGQAVDSSYIATEELARVLSSGFAEPLRESAQFAGVVRGVLKYRVMKRLQEEMCREQLAQKRQQLEALEQSEQEARRIESYLHGGISSTERNSGEAAHDRDDVESLDSADFPPTHGEAASPPSTSPKRSLSTKGSAPNKSAASHKKSQSFGGGSFPGKIFGRLSYAVHGIVDVDPETTRRNNIGKTRETITQLEAALGAAEKDVKDTSGGVLKDLKRFQREKEEDLRRMFVVYAKCHIEWAKKNLETWQEAKEEVEKIQVK